MDLVKVDNVNKPFAAMTALPIIRQAGLLVGLAASIALGIYAVLWSQQGGFVPVAPNLSSRDSSKVISILQTANIEYKIDQTTGSVLVSSSQLQKAKLKMAAEGISGRDGVGYELLEKEQGISTSQFMETVRYQRAIQGELSRTISSMASIKSARVHLAIPKQTPFIRSKRKSSASIFLNLYSGRQLTDEQVSSIVSLVAMSIPNLQPKNVTVIDHQGRLLSSSNKESGVELSNTQLKYTNQLEKDYANRIESILMPIVGLGRIKAQVVANVDFDQIEKTREEFDSDQPSIRSERKVQEQSIGNSAPIGIPGALTNQPPGTGVKRAAANALTGESNGPSRNSSQSTLNYELNKTISHTRYSVAKIRRLTVAVVVDNKMELVAQAPELPAENPEEGAEPAPPPVIKKVLTSVPRTAEEIASFTILVKDAIGFNALRGDRVNIINAPFVKPEKIEALPEIPIWKQDWVLDIAKQALGILFVLYLVFGILRPVMRKLAAHQPVVIPDEEEEEELDEDQITLSEQAEQQQQLIEKHEDNLTAVKSMVAEDPKLVAQVVKNWVASE